MGWPQGSCQDQSLGSWWPLCSGEGDSSYNSQFFPLHYGVWPVIYSLILGYWCHCQVWSWPTKFCTFKTLETILDTQDSGYISLGCLSFQLLALSLGWQSTYWSPQRRENISQSYDWLGNFSIYSSLPHHLNLTSFPILSYNRGGGNLLQWCIFYTDLEKYLVFFPHLQWLQQFVWNLSGFVTKQIRCLLFPLLNAINVGLHSLLSTFLPCLHPNHLL